MSDSDGQGSSPTSSMCYWIMKTKESTPQSQLISVQLPEDVSLSPDLLDAASTPPPFLCLGAI